MRVFAFVSRQRAEFPVKTLCRVCRVSTSGYYGWEARRAAGPTSAQLAEQELVEQIRSAHAESRGRYGSPRTTAQLVRDGVVVNHKRVERLMAREGLRGRCGRRRVRTTVADPKAVPAPDLVERRFEQQTLDVLWVGDVTYIPTDEGWLYLATVLDACSRRLLGWSLADHLRTELCLGALEAAVGCRGGKGKVGGVVFHSDRGPVNTRPRSTAAPVQSWASGSRWAASVIRTTTPWPSRSSPGSSERPSTASTSPPRSRRAPRCSNGSSGTTQGGSTAPSATDRPSSTSSTSPISYLQHDPCPLNGGKLMARR